MISYTRPSDLPEPAQRVVAWCLADWTLVAEPAARGRRYRLQAPPGAPRNRGPAPGKVITAGAAETAAVLARLPNGDGTLRLQEANDLAQLLEIAKHHLANLDRIHLIECPARVVSAGRAVSISSLA